MPTSGAPGISDRSWQALPERSLEEQPRSTRLDSLLGSSGSLRFRRSLRIPKLRESVFRGPRDDAQKQFERKSGKRRVQPLRTMARAFASASYKQCKANERKLRRSKVPTPCTPRTSQRNSPDGAWESSRTQSRG